jgi:hypothetical protein
MNKTAAIYLIVFLIACAVIAYLIVIGVYRGNPR